MLNLRVVVKNNLFLKIISIIIGFFLWMILNESLTINKLITVPIYFYNLKDSVKIDAPNFLIVRVCGKKSAISELSKEKIALYIDANQLKPGKNPYKITEQDLFFSPGISITDYKPHQITISVV